jgi:hypothetical protein
LAAAAACRILTVHGSRFWVMHPMLYEINTRCWLRDLSDACGREVTLATVPEAEFARWQERGFTHIWLMGVWATGPKVRAAALREPGLRQAYDEVLPGWRAADVGGSPYAIADYQVPRALGGEPGLARFRQTLHARGLQLVLDFVPNHVGLDHRWLRERPELFVQSPVAAPGTFAQETAGGVRWLAHGKDPFFPPWTDTAQLDYRRPGTRAAMKELLLSVAARCDGVRCDMAMLLLNEVFGRTWASFPLAAETPSQEFWADAIPAVKRRHPEFLFLAEVYWDLEARMQALGFDYTYDKRLYDELFWRNGPGAQRRLLAQSPEFIAASAHFLENHDEPRIAGRLAPAEHRGAALVILGLPGMRFLHEGQLTGARLKLPVQLARRPREPADPEVTRIYDRLLTTLPCTAVGNGQAQLLAPRPAWPGNSTAANFILVQWREMSPDNSPLTAPHAGTEFDLVVVNFAPHRSQCYAPLTVPGLAERNWTLRDLLGEESYERFGADLAEQGLYLDLPAYGAQVFHFEPSG